MKMKGLMCVHLYHGRKDKFQDMDDGFGEDGPLLGPFTHVQVTYADEIRCFYPKGTGPADEDDEFFLGIDREEQVIYYDGMWYGGYSIHNAATALQDKYYIDQKRHAPNSKLATHPEGAKVMNKELLPFDEQTFFAIYIGEEGHMLQAGGEYIGTNAGSLNDVYHTYEVPEADALAAKLGALGVAATLGPYPMAKSPFQESLRIQYEKLRKDPDKVERNAHRHSQQEKAESEKHTLEGEGTYRNLDGSDIYIQIPNHKDEKMEQQFDYDKIPQETLDRISDLYLKDLSWAELISTPGVGDILRESYNNEILELCKDDIEGELEALKNAQETILEEFCSWVFEGDLLMLDGEKGHVNVAVEAVDEGVTIEANSSTYPIMPGEYKIGSDNEYVELSMSLVTDAEGPCCHLVWGKNNLVFRRAYAETNKTSLDNLEALKGKIVVFTGFRSPEMQEKVETLGGKVVNAVTKNTDYLVCLKINTSSKQKKAKALGIEVISKDYFKKCLGLGKW